MVLDCGTGARALGMKLAAEHGRELDLLFTHFHMDHVFGFPFFAPLYTPGYVVRTFMPAMSSHQARERIARYLNGIYHPTTLRDVPAELSFRAIKPGEPFNVGSYTVDALRLNHPGGSVAYRIRRGSACFAYVTDTAPFAKPGDGLAAGGEPKGREQAMVDFLTGCDVVVYDTMYDFDEYLERMTWGHSYPEYALALCRAAGVRHVKLFHHAPDHDDDRLDARARRYAEVEDLKVSLAREGGHVNVEG